MKCSWSFASLTSFSCFFKPIRISWSSFYQLHVLMLTLRTHHSMIFGGMNGKSASENFFWKWISRGRRKWWNDCSKLSLSWLKYSCLLFTMWIENWTFFTCGNIYMNKLLWWSLMIYRVSNFEISLNIVCLYVMVY